ncbi:Histone chaperone domain CHZ [Lithohypha guttulata]|nr:Histone chaperone domain CHZ [Lithohypha guttulata]
MSAEDTTAAQQPSEISGKSKGKQAEQVEAGDMSMDDDEDSAEDSGVEEAPEEGEDDDLEEIDQDNIVGARTRGKNIDWAEAEQKLKEDGQDAADDDEDDDDDDFVDPDDAMKD